MSVSVEFKSTILKSDVIEMSKGKKKPWDDNWQILRPLGGGGQGNAFLVKHRDEADREYVLKVLKSQKALERRERLHREVQALQLLQHPAIPKVVESNTHAFADIEVPLYFVIEYVEGQTLEERVSNGRLKIDEAVRLIIQLSDILAHCHDNGILHRDIKPDNIILRGVNTIDPVLIDFGLSFNKEDAERARLTPIDQQLGNRFLHLPELQTGDSTKRHAESDISQVCGLLFYALTGNAPGHLADHEDRKPHERASAKMILDQIALPSLISLFEKGFERVMDKRFHSFQAFKGRLHEVLDDFEYHSVSVNQNAVTVTLETIKPEIKATLSQGSGQELLSDESVKAKETKSHATQEDYYKGDHGDALMYASLLGAWNEKSEGDRDAIRELIEGDD